MFEIMASCGWLLGVIFCSVMIRPFANALDSQVTLRHSDGTSACYQASRKVESGSAVSEAYAIPDELVLSRSLSLPTIAEADLEAALHLEIAACSPFSVDDTASGWRIIPWGRQADAHRRSGDCLTQRCYGVSW